MTPQEAEYFKEQFELGLRHGSDEQFLRRRLEQWPYIAGQFGELAHIGWQASLSGRPGEGFTPRSQDAMFLAQGDKPVETIANLPYSDLPEAKQNAYISFAGVMVGYITECVAMRKTFDEQLMLEGRKRIFKANMHALHGNTSAVYKDNHEDERKYELVNKLNNAYDTVEPGLRRADENIACLGLLALKHPGIFPSLKDRFPDQKYWDYIEQEPGINEGAMRGLAAINRVIKIQGYATGLQGLLQYSAKFGD